jgi:hypothetical protein
MTADNSGQASAKATPQQMALTLFEDMFDIGTPINEASREIGYQRNNLFTEIVNVGLPARRFLDAAYFLIAQEASEKDFFDVDLNYFKWLMRYDSRNLKHLRSVADECQNGKIRVTSTPPGEAPRDDDSWVSVQLMGTVAMHRGRIGFRVPPELLPHIRDPQRSHWLSLRIATAFTRSLARAIYDRILPSVQHGRTDWIPLDEVRSWPGKMGANAAIFKYFKRDWLEPAIKEINEISDIELRYETRSESPSSKKIDRIRFVDLKRKATADAVLVNLSDASELYMTLKNEFGLSTEQFTEISENRNTWTDERILQAVEYTRYRLNQGVVKKSPAGYLMQALRGNWNVSEAELKMHTIQRDLLTAKRLEEEEKTTAHKAVQASAAMHEAATRDRVNEEIRLGRAHFTDADVKTRKDLIRMFLASPLHGKIMLRRHKLVAADITEANILTLHTDIVTSFCQFVFAKTAKTART